MALLTDTNILVRLAEPDNPDYAMIRSAVDTLVSRGEELCYGSQNRSPAFLAALEPWLRHIVIVGGWAHQLYRLHPHAQHLDYPPLSTLDTDVALPTQLPAGKPDIRTRLLEEH